MSIEGSIQSTNCKIDSVLNELEKTKVIKDEKIVKSVIALEEEIESAV